MKTAAEILEKICPKQQEITEQQEAERQKLAELRKKWFEKIDEATEKMYAEALTITEIDFGEGNESGIIFNDTEIAYLIEKNGLTGIGCRGTRIGFLQIKK